MDSKDDINMKYEPLDNEVDGVNYASGSEGANVIKVLKSELENYVNIKCEPLDYAHNETDSVSDSVTEFHPTLAKEKFLQKEAEDDEEEEKIDIKYESLDHGLKSFSPAIENTNEHTEKHFECHKCSFKSKYKQVLKRHIMFIHEKEKMPQHACQSCSFKTVHLQQLNRHIMSKHAENRKPFECYKCSYKSKDKNCLRKHILFNRDKEKVAQYACEICSYRTIHKSKLKKHMVIHTEFSLECTLCHKSFKQKKSLDAHYVYMHRDQSDSFKHLLTKKVNQCSKCSYITLDISSLKRHLLTHEDDQGKFKFECYTCGYKCGGKSCLIRHVRTHADQLPFACSECNKRFNEKQLLHGHIVFKHKENEELMKTVTSKIHQCLDCSYNTVKAHDFKRHIKQCNNK